MASTLVSPGVSIQIQNESYYIPATAPTVPLLFIATRADKKQADGVTAAAGALEHSIVRTITSLNQSVSTYGIPMFRTDNTGAQLHGDARNEYGLMALNQALTILSSAYVVRANVDLADADVITYSSSTPVPGANAGTGSMSIPVVNQASGVDQLWTLVGAAISGPVDALGAITPGSLYTTSLTGTVSTLGAITPGSLYTNGVYSNVPLTGGTGTGATANITVSGGVVTVVTLAAVGIGYTAGDVLSATAASIGGTGAGFSIPVATIIGVYANVPLTNITGTGAGATANITVAGGAVTAVVLVSAGSGYAVGNTLSAAAASIGGTGAGFSIPVATIPATSFTVSGFTSGSQAAAPIGALYNNGLVSFTITQGSTQFATGDSFTFTVSHTTATNPLGVGDTAKRLSIVTALKAEINSNQDVRSEIYEYNLILCPGYYETATELLNLNLAINEEAFIISDCPFNKSPEDTAVWSGTIDRENSQNIAYYYPNAMASNLDGVTVFCAASGVALKTIAYSDSVSEVWYPPAGERRGLVSGVSDIGYVTGTLGTATTFVSTPLNQGQRDILYQTAVSTGRINIIPALPGKGILVFGQKTSAPLASALDRINVMRLMMLIKRDVRKASFAYLFELNDRITRDAIKQTIDNYLHDILMRRGLYDYVVVCDLSNNTPTRIDRNELWVDIALKPEKAIEFIYIPIRVVSTGASL
jgi:phage tail sheath protein FI